MFRTIGVLLVNSVCLMMAFAAFGEEPHVCSCVHHKKIDSQAGSADGKSLRLAGRVDSFWPKRDLRVQFLNGELPIRNKVFQVAREWEKVCGVRFTEVNSSPSDIRVTFNAGKGSWSYVGTDAEMYPGEATMNFGWFTEDTPDAEYHRTVLHEFGHALGFIHEHQNPNGGIKWNREVAIEYYTRTQNWTLQQVEHNVFETYASDTVNATAFDSKSIMLYAIPKNFTTNGFETQSNFQLSELDKALSNRIYPSTDARPNFANGVYTLENGDNPGYFLAHWGPAKRGAKERNVSIDHDKIKWRITSVGDDAYTLENVDNPGYFVAHWGPAKRGATERNVSIDKDKIKWRIRRVNDHAFTLENIDNPGFFLAHTGPAKRGPAERNVVIDPDRVPWLITEVK